jgi:D-3-phosphoglycerate dehydrogenase
MKISITDCDHGFTDPERKIIEGAGFELATFQSLESTDVMDIARDSDALICQYADINRSVLESLDRCKIVARYGVGLDNIDVASATEFGVKVLYVPYFCFHDVANHAMGLILALSRNIVGINRVIREQSKDGQVSYADMLKFMDNVERPGKQTIGIIGLGKIGKQVSRRASCFGYNVIAYDPYIPGELISIWDARKVSFEELLKTSDFISIHAPLTNETEEMIGSSELNQLKSSAYIINTARGKIIDESALKTALESGQIAGAALDVFEQEPIAKDHPFLGMNNVIITPHVGFYSKTSLIELKSSVAQYTVNALKGEGSYEIANPSVEDHGGL